jgi:cytochrome c
MKRYLSAAAAALGMITLASAANAQSAENGEAVFKVCKACHQVGATAKNGVGPILNGIVGRKASSVEGFNYSDASKAAAAGGLVWTEDKLLTYLTSPATFMPKTKMAFAGVKDEADRKDLVAYLKTLK